MEGGGVVRRRITLLDRLSAADNGGEAVAGLTLEAVLGGLEKRSSAAAAAAMAPTSNRRVNRTLLDVIRDEEPHGGSLFGHKDKKSWKAFRDRIRLIRAGAAWTSSIHIPTSDMPIENHNNARSLGSGGFGNTSRSFMSRRNSARFTTVSSLNQGGLTQREDSGANISVSSSSISGMTRRSSSQFGPTTPISTDSSDEADENIHSVGEGPPSRSFRPQMVNPYSEDENEEPAREGGRHLATLLAQDRAMSVREAVADQEAAEAEAATAAEAEGDGTDEGAEVSAEAQLVRMSLMDLLEETDWQMGLVGSKHTVGDMYDKKEEDGEEDGGGGGGSGGGLEPTCCVCMVRHKGAAFIPCGHTFCRLCSRELWAQRGNCPLCNGFIVEVLDIF